MRWRPPTILGAILAALMLVQVSPALGDFSVDSVHTHLDDGMLVMDAHIDYAFSKVALEALDNGVPLTLEVHIQLRRAGAWMWEESLVDQRLRYLISYKPLSERYTVARLPAQNNARTYVTRDAAIGALGSIEGLQLVPESRLEVGEKYVIEIRASLDVEELPLPLRPIAYLLPSWKLSSGWTKWPLKP
jgi:hypothetical protein